MSITFSKGRCLPSWLQWKNQYSSSVFCPGNLFSVPLCPVAQLGSVLNYILHLRTRSVCQLTFTVLVPPPQKNTNKVKKRFLQLLQSSDGGWRSGTDGGDSWFEALMCRPSNVNLWVCWKPCYDQKRHFCRQFLGDVLPDSLQAKFSSVTLVFSSQTIPVMVCSHDTLRDFCFVLLAQSCLLDNMFFLFFLAVCVYWPQTASGHFPPLPKNRV